MTTFKIISGLEKSVIKILSKTDAFYRFEYIEWCDRTYLHINGHISEEVRKQISDLSY